MSVQYVQALLFKAANIRSATERKQKARPPDWMRLRKLRLDLKDRLQRLADAATPKPALQPARVTPARQFADLRTWRP